MPSAGHVPGVQVLLRKNQTPHMTQKVCVCLCDWSFLCPVLAPENIECGRLPPFQHVLLTESEKSKKKKYSNKAVLCFRLEMLADLQFGYKE